MGPKNRALPTRWRAGQGRLLTLGDEPEFCGVRDVTASAGVGHATGRPFGLGSVGDLSARGDEARTIVTSPQVVQAANT